ncbi:MAG: BrnA antitoxin family protein [Marinomonas sp.]|uniref:BrnA antitoxin family protein n=1 Tax=unclassified Marinomonas TaxID=196814 RepID=UPI002934750B|nr:BrnA antitoxin family protein [Marinomonas sp. GJ51-6]WOD07808.1 BrnA antitoxin family protein [Marinomonas sp. GJ51-6]
MRDQYDFSNSVPNPYVKKSKKQITIRLDQDVIDYFKQLSEQNGVPYQNLINLYLKECAQSHKELKLNWQ